MVCSKFKIYFFFFFFFFFFLVSGIFSFFHFIAIIPRTTFNLKLIKCENCDYKSLFNCKQIDICWRFFILFFLHYYGPAVRVFANGPGDLGSIPGRVIPKTLKMVLDTTLLNTQHYKVRFKGKVEQSWEWSSALPYTLV